MRYQNGNGDWIGDPDPYCPVPEAGVDYDVDGFIVGSDIPADQRDPGGGWLGKPLLTGAPFTAALAAQTRKAILLDGATLGTMRRVIRLLAGTDEPSIAAAFDGTIDEFMRRLLVRERAAVLGDVIEAFNRWERYLAGETPTRFEMQQLRGRMASSEAEHSGSVPV